MISLDTALSLTRGSPVGMSAMLSQLRPSLDSFTITSSVNGDPPLVGQIHYKQGERSARITFLAPSSASRSPALPNLLDGLARQAGEWGAYHLLAEVEEYSPVFEALRRGGYSLYAWQRIWQLDKPAAAAKTPHPGVWQPAASIHEIAVRNLYQSLVPPLVQSAEPLPSLPPHSLVYCQDGEIMGFVTATYGPQGIYLLPLLHPGVENVSGLLTNLLLTLPRATELPLYLSVRSYMGWLEATLETFNCRAAPRQALMVKHLVTPQRVPVLAPHLVPLEKRQAEPTATIINNMSANVTHDPTSNN